MSNVTVKAKPESVFVQGVAMAGSAMAVVDTLAAAAATAMGLGLQQSSEPLAAPLAATCFGIGLRRALLAGRDTLVGKGYGRLLEEATGYRQQHDDTPQVVSRMMRLRLAGGAQPTRQLHIGAVTCMTGVGVAIAGQPVLGNLIVGYGLDRFCSAWLVRAEIRALQAAEAEHRRGPERRP